MTVQIKDKKRQFVLFLLTRLYQKKYQLFYISWPVHAMMYKSCTKATIKYDIYDPFNNYLLFFQQNRNPHLRKWRKIENILAKPKNVRSLFSASASNKILFSYIYFALNFRASSLARNKSPSKTYFDTV